MNSKQAIVVEHTHGLSVSTPKCNICGKYPDSMGHKVYFYATGGVHFNDLFYYCRKCRNTMRVPPNQLETLNRYSDASRESFNKIVWQSPPDLSKDNKSETFFET